MVKKIIDKLIGRKDTIKSNIKEKIGQDEVSLLVKSRIEKLMGEMVNLPNPVLLQKQREYLIQNGKISPDVRSFPLGEIAMRDKNGNSVSYEKLSKEELTERLTSFLKPKLAEMQDEEKLKMTNDFLDLFIQDLQEYKTIYTTTKL